ncbi:MAG TPA: NnrS family protein [Usitatibacteraceae bacterium]|nr:NnrS family protein [Usitatibacteraceae bacterium]
MPESPPGGFALWNLGFRPFYLLASIFSAASIAVWAAQYAGWLPAGAYLKGHLWHAHEMLFGYTVAVVAGFLLTAVRNWTNQTTPSGMLLAGLAALWVAGRVLALAPWPVAAAVVNAAFPVAIAVAIAVPMVRSANRRNYFFAALLAFMGVAVLAFHLSNQGTLSLPPRLGLLAGLDLVLFIMVVMGGRVIPMFTNNGVPGTNARRTPATERFALGSVLVLLAADLAQVPAAVVGTVAVAAAIAHAVRLALWQPWRTLHTPLVWVLHGAYAWIVVHLALRALAAAGLVGESLALHALTLGAIGGLTIGMMTRTAKGHTGRQLKADGYEVAAYGLVMAAALVRVAGGILLPGAYPATVAGSAALWSAAFAIYAVRYWPVLTRPRIDGKPG